jgi:hypothetical protein
VRKMVFLIDADSLLFFHIHIYPLFMLLSGKSSRLAHVLADTSLPSQSVGVEGFS